METIINNVISTLDTIPVAGIENMRRMVGCVDALAALSNALRGAGQNTKQETQAEATAAKPQESTTEIAMGTEDVADG